MKKTRKLSALLLAIVMTFALTVPVFAVIPPTAEATVLDAEARLVTLNPANFTAVIEYLNANVLTAYPGVTASNVSLVVTQAQVGIVGSIVGDIELSSGLAQATVTLDISIPALSPPVVGGTGTETVDGVGLARFAERPDVFQVSLPTTGSLNFVLDPMGLHGLEVGAEIDFDALEGGFIVPTSEPVGVINNSNLDIALSVAVTGLTSDGGVDTQEEATFIAGTHETLGAVREAVNTGDNNNVALFVVPAATGVSAADDAFVPATRGFGVANTERTLAFVLDEARYTYTLGANDSVTPTLVTGSGSGTLFQIGGLVNQNANWSDFTAATDPSTIGLAAVFTWVRATEANTGNDVTGVAFLQDLTGATPPGAAPPWSVPLTGDLGVELLGIVSGAPSIGFTQSTLTGAAGAWLGTPFTFGEYTAGAITINGIAVGTGAAAGTQAVARPANGDVALFFPAAWAGVSNINVAVAYTGPSGPGSSSITVSLTP